MTATPSNPSPTTAADDSKRTVPGYKGCWPAGSAVAQPTGPAGVGRYPYDTRPVPIDAQEWIITLGRRGWRVNRIAQTMGLARETVRRHLDGWGIARVRRGRERSC